MEGLCYLGVTIVIIIICVLLNGMEERRFGKRRR